MKKKRSFPMVLVMLSSILMSCGQGSASSNTYSMWLYNAMDTSFYNDYGKNPALQYLQTKTWKDNKVNFDFWVPAAGSQQDNYDTIVGSGDYPCLLQNSVSDPAPVMYENNMITDITDLVKENMPNYYKLIQENTSLKNATTFNLDGQERILSLTTLNEDVPYNYCGPVYRRDWIAKYGTNPKTGVKFTGGYTSDDVDSWQDDVIFPSGGTDPVYISDWEWMFDIFQDAQADLGITDSYCISEYYTGYTWGTGGLNSSFGESNPVWYQSTDEGRPVRFGGVEDSMRSYLQCLNSWYTKGYLDKEFYTRTRDAYYSIDSTNVRLGKVGMWTGLESDLGGRLDLHNGGLTSGIYVEGCTWPINDVYGSEKTKNVVPNGVASDSMTGTGFFVMKGADKKYDLAPLLSMIDYLYTEEGSVIRSLGLNSEQLSQLEDNSFYQKYGMSDGAYTKGADGRYVLCDAIQKDAGGLSVAACLDKFPGYQLVTSIDHGYAANYEASLQKWTKYKNSIMIWGSTAEMNMSTEDNNTAQKALNKVLDYMNRNVYKYVTGQLDPNSDSTWSTWCSALERFDYDTTTALLQKYCDSYPVG